MAFEGSWKLSGIDEQRAPERLSIIVANLTRQKWRQLFVEYAWVGLFFGLSVATVAVVMLKMLAPGQDTSTWVAFIVGSSLAIAGAKAWSAKPDELQVAIYADLSLKLKQRLSTAWEFTANAVDAETSRRLAVQAVNQRYPPPSQAVFPLRITTWARLLPIAAVTLTLVSVLDFDELPHSPVAVIDEVVLSEGVRLREFARQMQVRAQNDSLPRSESEAKNLKRLGERMESGSLSRDEAVSRLQNLSESLARQRRAALSEGTTAGAVSQSFSGAGDGEPDPSQLRDLLEQLLRGELTASEVESISQDTQNLARLGISADELSNALSSYSAGDPLDVQQMVDDLERQELAWEDARELGRALEQVDESRENLGDVIVSAEELMAQSGPDRSARGTPSRGNPRGRNGEQLIDGPMNQAGFGEGDGVTPRNKPQTLDPNSPRNDIVLKARSEFREGSGFTTETRVLPRAGRATVESVELDTRFEAQMEEVLSKENYPLHQKEFIRRYFLSLSQGVSGETSVPEEQR